MVVVVVVVKSLVVRSLRRGSMSNLMLPLLLRQRLYHRMSWQGYYREGYEGRGSLQLEEEDLEEDREEDLDCLLNHLHHDE
jgi:hypothetical protein